MRRVDARGDGGMLGPLTPTLSPTLRGEGAYAAFITIT